MTTDITLQQAKLPSDTAKLLPPPNYLILLDEGAKRNFLALRLDEMTNNYVKCIGVYTKHSVDKIIKDYSSLIKEIDPSNVVEIMFPWTKINSIQSLIYKYKGSK